jgi:hypothetical protein
MLILRSWEHERLDVPAAVEVLEIVEGTGDRRRWSYARARLTPYDAASGEAEQATLRRRAGKRWRTPRPGRTMEVLVWTDLVDAGAGPFEEPASGAAICYLVEDSMENQVRAWTERTRW